MPWLIKSVSEGPVCVSDINATFTKGQIRDIDLHGGRGNAERSNDLKMLIMKGYLKEIQKDPISIGPVADVGNIVEPLTKHLGEVHKTIHDRADSHADDIKRIEAVQTDMRKELSDHKKEVVELNKRVVSLNETILTEFRAFADKHPMQTQVILQAMKNIVVERGSIAEKMATLQESDMSEADLLAEDRMLKMRDKKLEKNFTNLGKTMSVSATDDIQESLKALEGIDLSK